MSETFILPEPRTTAPRRNIRSLLIVGGWKCGKTSACAAVPNSLVAMCRSGGADFCNHGRIVETYTCKAYLELVASLTAARKAGKPLVQRFVTDDIGIVDDWVFDLALAKFKESPLCSGKLAGIEHILDLPAGGPSGGSVGWRWQREEMGQMHFRICEAAEEVIFVANTRDKVVNKERGEVVVDDVDIAGGKGRRLFCGQTSAIGFMYRRMNAGADELVLSFKSGTDVIGGSHPQHLTGKEFVIASSTGGGPPTFDWSAVFLPD